MKKLYFLICLCITASLLNAQVSKTVSATAGNLRTAFTTAEQTTVTNLMVTGTIDARDFKFMRDTLSVLSVLDLSAVSIQAYTGTGGTYSTSSTAYPSNGIPQYAFCNQNTGYSKTTLKTITLPTSITSIGNYAFQNCSGLTGSLLIPNYVTTIGIVAFSNCSGIKTLIIGSSVTSIGDQAFYYCSGIKIIYSLNTTPPTNSIYGVFIGVNPSIVYVPASSVAAYKAATGWSNFPISGPGVTVSTGSITGLNYVPGATSSDQKFFAVGGGSLTGNVVLTAPTNFEISTTSGTAFVAAASITLSPVGGMLALDTIYVRLKTGLALNTYTGTISISSTGVPSQTIALTGIVRPVPETINVSTTGTLGSLLSPSERAAITKLTVTGNIDARDFKFMRDSLSVLSVLDLSTTTINSVTTTNQYGSSVTYPANEIPQSAFSNKSSIKSITLPTSITSIGAGAFNWCRSLSGSLTIPNSVTFIGNSAFYSCGFSGNLTLGSAVTSIGSDAFGQCNFSIINSLNATPPTLASTFYYMSTAPIVYVPASGVTAYKAASVWSTYTIVTDKNITINNPTAGSLAATIIATGYGPLSSITHLTITGNLNDIDIAQIKTNMTVLSDLDLSGATLTNNILPTGAFQSKTTLYSVQLPATLKTIRNNAFNGCTTLSGTLSIPVTVDSIGSYAFNGCSSISGKLNLPSGIKKIGDYAFNQCTKLNGSLTIPNLVTSIGNYAFRGCTGFTDSLNLSSSVITIGSYAFYGCTGFKGSLIIPNSVTSIGDAAFYGCSGFTGNLIIPNSVTTLGSYNYYGYDYGYGVFYNCSGLSGKLTLSNSLKTINGYTFYGCSNLSDTLTIPASVRSIGSYAFYGNAKLAKVSLSKNDSIIGDYAFYNCTGLKQISVPRSVPPAISANTFIGVNKETCTLTVPTGSAISYQTANYWSQFIFYNESAVSSSYGLTVQVGANGTVKESNTVVGNGSILTVDAGTNKTFTFTPAPGYEIMTLTYNGTDVKSKLSNNQYTTASINANATLIVTFQKAQYHLAIKSAESGTVNLLSEYGATPSFDFTASSGWKVNTVLYNGTDVTSSLVSGVYTVPAILANAQLTVSFELSNALTATSYSNVKVYTAQSEIIVEGTSQGEAVSIYTLGGVQLQTVKSQGDRLAIKAEQGAVYLVKTASKTVKVVL